MRTKECLAGTLVGHFQLNNNKTATGYWLLKELSMACIVLLYSTMFCTIPCFIYTAIQYNHWYKLLHKWYIWQHFVW